MEGVALPRHGLLDRSLSLPGGMQIFVQAVDGPRLTFDVLHEDTVLQVKTQISQRIDRPVSSFELLYGTRRLLDDQTMNDCEIMHEAILSLVHKVSQINLFLTTAEKNLSIRIASNASVADLKAVAREKARLPEGFLLVHDGISLLDERQRLDQLNIVNDSTLAITFTVDGA